MKNLVLISIIFFFYSCEKEIGINDLITKVEYEQKDLIANGSDKLKIKVFYNKEAQADLISLKITTTNSVIVETSSTKYDAIAEKDSLGNLFSNFSIKSSNIVSPIEVNLSILGYEKSFEINTISSIPEIMNLSANSFSVENNFDSEIQITGYVKTAAGLNPSAGYKVKLIDKYLDGGLINGRFREESLNVDESGKISAVYSPGLIDSCINIHIIGEVYNKLNEKLSIKDTLLIYVK